MQQHRAKHVVEADGLQRANNKVEAGARGLYQVVARGLLLGAVQMGRHLAKKHGEGGEVGRNVHRRRRKDGRRREHVQHCFNECLVVRSPP